MKKSAGILATTLLVVLFSLLSAVPAAADTVTLYPTDDAFVRNEYPDHNDGSYQYLTLYHVVGRRDTSFLRFNLSSIPANSRIDNATFYLYLELADTTSNLNISILRCIGSWDELSVTWNNAPSVILDPAAESTFTRRDHVYQTIDVTDLVQSWVNAEYPNDGFRLAYPRHTKETFRFIWVFHSKEGDNSPKLTVNYTPPAASGSETGSTGSGSTSSSTSGTATGSTEPTPVSSAPATGSQITKVKAERIKISSAYVTWTTDVDSNSYVEYGETTKYGKTFGTDDRVKAHSVQLIELRPDKIYHFRVKSTNADGHQVVSKDYTFRTAEEPKIGETEKKEEKSNIWLWVAIGGLGLLVLVLGGILIFLYIRNRRRKNPPQKS